MRLPEDRGLYPDAQVLPMIVYLAGLRGLPRAEAEGRARAWLARLDLAGRERDRVDALSKGNQQKVQLIASLLHEPALVVLDEPFAGFDPVNQDRVSRLIGELREAGTTVILSAHHMDLVEALADRLLRLVAARAEVVDVHSEVPTLRELYLRAVGADPASADSADATDAGAAP